MQMPSSMDCLATGYFIVEVSKAAYWLTLEGGT